MSTPVIFDIETGPLPIDDLKKIVPPFSPPEHPGEFDSSQVKYGNATKEDTRAKILEAAREKHIEACRNFEATVKLAEENYWRDVLADAALSAVTGQVLVIGYRGERTLVDGVDETKGITEAVLINRFWMQYRKLRADGRQMIGFNIAGFDIPFLVQRSWVLGISVPDSLFTGPQRYLDQMFVDLLKIWKAGNFSGGNRLDEIARAFGIGGKPEGVYGADFHRLYRDPQTRPEAIDYSVNDLDMTWKIAERMGFV